MAPIGARRRGVTVKASGRPLWPADLVIQIGVGVLEGPQSWRTLTERNHPLRVRYGEEAAA